MTLRAGGIALLTRGHIASEPGVFALAAAGVAVSTAVLTLVAALGFGLRALLLDDIVGRLPVGVIEVTAPTIELGPLAVTRPAFLGGSGALDAKKLAALEKLPGVEWASGEATLHVPARAVGTVFGHGVATDLAVAGIDPRLVAGDLLRGEKFDGVALDAAATSSPGDVAVPVLVSSTLLRLFNSNIAPSYGLPQVRPEALSAIRFTLTVGEGGILGRHKSGKVFTLRARIVGVSAHAIAAGVTIPLSMVRALGREFDGEHAALDFTRAWVKADPVTLAAVSDGIQALGLDADASQRFAGGLIAFGLALPAGLAIAMLISAGLGMALVLTLQVRQRRRAIGIWRTLGANGGDVLRVVLYEAAIVGAAGGAAGTIVAASAATGVEKWLPRIATGLPYVPARLFVMPVWLVLAAVLVAVLCAVAGALGPARMAASIQPVDAVRD